MWKKTYFMLAKNVKNYLVLKYYILVLLVHLCIVPIVHAQTLFFISIYKQDIILLQPKNIEIVSNIYYVIFIELLIWIYFTKGNQSYKLFGCADAKYLSDSHKVRSQTRYVFYCNGIIIYFMKICQINSGGYIIKLFKNICNSWSKLWMYMVKMYDLTYSGIMLTLFYQR